VYELHPLIKTLSIVEKLDLQGLAAYQVALLHHILNMSVFSYQSLINEGDLPWIEPTGQRWRC